MLNTLSLLSMKHTDAMRAMLQDALEPGVTVNHLMTGNAVANFDGTMSVGVYLTPSAYQVPTWIYRGQSRFSYHRMSFADFFQGITLTLAVPESTRTRNIVNMLERIFHIDIDDEDYINEDIQHHNVPMSYRLKANPLSQRWRGYVDIVLTARGASASIPIPYLNGITLSPVDLLSIEALDGLRL